MADERKTLTVEMDDLLSLIACAEDYGYGDEVFYDFCAGVLGRKLSDGEIEAYARSFLTPEMRAKGYGEEDYESNVERLRNFRDRYAKGDADG